MEETPTPKPSGRRAQLGLALALLLLVGGSWVNSQLSLQREQEWHLQGLLGEAYLAHGEVEKAIVRVEVLRSSATAPPYVSTGLARLEWAEAREERAKAKILDHLVDTQGLTLKEAQAWLSFRRARWAAKWRGYLLVR